MPKPTINDVAAEAGVSIKTVSRVVNREAAVTDRTRAHVQAVIDRLGYSPNVSARRMGGQRSFQLALLYLANAPGSTYYIDIQNGLLDVCNAAGYGLTVCPSEGTSEHAVKRLQESFKRLRPDGVIVTPPFSDFPDVLELLRAEGVRYVCISPRRNSVEAVTVQANDRRAARKMVSHLIGLGHRRIGLVAGHPEHGVSEERERGVREALEEHGLSLPTMLRAQGYFTFDDGLSAGLTLLKLKRPPTAIFCANDIMAFGVLHAAHRLGFSVPADLSVSGFDDTPAAAQFLPTLSTVRQPVAAMAASAGELLLNCLRHPDQNPVRVRLDCELVLRESTAPPKSRGATTASAAVSGG